MDQNWVAVDLDERVCLHGGGKLREWLWSDPGSLLDALCVPNTHATIDNLLAGCTAVQRSPLFRLPPELVDQIFHQIVISSGTYDARLLLFALACKALLACARRHIVRLQTRRHAPLAGHRLICIGDGATTLEDYPPSLLTSADVQMLRVPREDAHTPPSAAEDEDRMMLYAHATTRWWRYFFRQPALLGSSGCSVGMAGLADLIYRPSTVSRMSMEDFVLFQALTTPTGADRYPFQGCWALCNLSKGEYVCTDGPGVDAWKGVFTLWQMLLACICWTSSRKAEDEDEDGLGLRGHWAGDRFEIRTLSPTGTIGWASNEAWKDVTHEVTRLLQDLQTRCGSVTTQ